MSMKITNNYTLSPHLPVLIQSHTDLLCESLGLISSRSDWALEYLEEDLNSGRKIIFNKQNHRIWNDANLHDVHQVAIHPQTFTVWCGIWAGVFGLYFFENDLIRPSPSMASTTE